MQTGGYVGDNTDPTLEMFSFDMNTGQLSLTFDEAIGYATFDYTAWTLLSRTGLLFPRLTGASVEPRDWYIINVNLSESDFDNLRILGYRMELYRDVNTSFIEAFMGAVMDTANNSLNRVGGPGANPLKADDFIPDVTQPTLVAFNFSLERDPISPSDQAYLDLYFSEPVDASRINYSLIEFHNSAHINNSAINDMYVLTGGNPDHMAVLRTVQLYLSLDDTNAIKALDNLATDQNNTYLIFREGAIEDVFYLPISEEDGYTVQATQVVPDTTQPVLESFTIDMDEGLLVFTFSETVDGVTLDPTLFTLQSSASSPIMQYTLTGGTPTLDATPLITLQISIDDLNAIKAIRGLATELTNTFVSVDEGGILDMTGLNLTMGVVPVSRNFTPDTTPPELVRFVLNLTSNELILTFNETVSSLPSDVILNRITIHSTANDTFGGVTLTSSSTVVSNDSTEVIIGLSSSDLNRLKVNTDLATSVSDTYITIEASAFVDMAMVANGNQEQTIMAEDFEEDLVSPSLTEWSFDLNKGIICLTFDEAVDVSSLNINSLSLLDSDNGTARVMFSITDHDAITNSTNGTLVKLYLTSNDLNRIKLNESLLTEVNSSYLSLESSFIADMNGQSLNPVEGLQASKFTNDTTRPFLVQASFDVVRGLLKLEFSETMNIASFDPTGITLSTVLYNMAANNSYTLTDGQLQNLMDDVVLRLMITERDQNELKAIMVGVTNITSWLAMENTTVTDQSDEPVLSETAFEVEISNFDNISPTLVSFVLNYTDETLTLTFSETVNGMALNVTDISILSSQDSASTNYSLSSRSSPAIVFDPVIVIQLDQFDVNELKRRLDLATNTSNTFISFSENLVSDVSGNPVVARPPSVALNATDVVEDRARPYLTEFEFDLDSGVLTLYMSETVLSSTVNATQFTLQSSSILTTETYTLTGGDVLTPDGPLLQILLTPDDLDRIKLMPSLADSANTTYLSFTEFAVADAELNLVEQITPNKARPTEFFTVDRTSPVLRSYDLDLNEGQLVFNFSEAVNITSFNLYGVTLSSGLVYNESTVIPLTGGSVSDIDRSIVYFNLTLLDLNVIKRFSDGFGKVENATLLRLSAVSVLDTSNNPVNGTVGLEVSTIIPDAIEPRVTGFDLDMNSGYLTLYLTETVFAEDVQPSEISLQNAFTFATSSAGYTLSPMSQPVQISDTIILINLTINDQNEIKRRPLLAIDNTTTYLTLTSKALNDSSGNPVVPVPVGSALNVTKYTMDDTMPDLASFSLDMDSGTLTLKFTETVNATTLVTQKLIFLDAIRPNATTNYTLTGQ